MRPDELAAALRQLPDDLRLRVEPLLRHASTSGCEHCERISDAVRLAFAAAQYDELSAAAKLIATAERSAADHERGSPTCGLRHAEHQWRRGQVARWARAPGPLIAATDASWKERAGGIGYVVSDGRWGMSSRGIDRHDPTGPSRVLINELRAVEYLLTAYAEPPPGLIVLVDSAAAVRVLRRWRSGDTGAMPSGYSLRPRSGATRPTLVRLAGVVATHPELTFKHVKAHAGHPLNEAADALCSMARRRRLEYFDIETRARDLVDAFLGSWHGSVASHRRS